MLIGVYSVFDRKSVAYGNLLFFVNDDIARRSMVEVMGERNNISLYPDDFDMYHVGTFNNETGELSPVSVRLAARFADFAGKEL
ncbi:nonstructural protein [Blackfly microvirus SF02]|uniref:Nonstructural protein n=1 Tax=Blackfly microvirus SF02 TaxID=2576452 RepID=A0A4P8PKT9_9VIRU|nr:nonstructural protein [Blackfly microvirus SF02]